MGLPFLGAEALILLGVTESELPTRSALRKVGVVLRDLRARRSTRDRSTVRRPDRRAARRRSMRPVRRRSRRAPATRTHRVRRARRRPGLLGALRRRATDRSCSCRTWSIFHSRHWKLQIPYLARHYRVVTFDGAATAARTGRRIPSAYGDTEFAADALAVMDATARTAPCSSRCRWAPNGRCSSPPSIPSGSAAWRSSLRPAARRPPCLGRGRRGVRGPHDDDDGWGNYNRHYWRRDYGDFLEFFFGAVPDRAALDEAASRTRSAGASRRIPRRSSRRAGTPAPGRRERAGAPVPDPTARSWSIHGTRRPRAPMGIGCAARGAGARSRWPSSRGRPPPHARDPVLVNLLLRDFIGTGRVVDDRR